jgi:hypothetical protein
MLCHGQFAVVLADAIACEPKLFKRKTLCWGEWETARLSDNRLTMD